MHGYKIHIWTAIYADDSGEFSHHARRQVIVHTSQRVQQPSSEKFSGLVNLRGEKVVGNTRMHEEFIHSVEDLGKVTYSVRVGYE